MLASFYGKSSLVMTKLSKLQDVMQVIFARSSLSIRYTTSFCLLLFKGEGGVKGAHTAAADPEC